MQHRKVKSQVGKIIKTNPGRAVRETLSIVADVVGCTLGPGGKTVLIERQETGLPPFLTKDGVTVYRALGFEDSVKDSILELVRDAAVRTANEAGDGTTTATILAASFIGSIYDYVDQNPHVSPQRLSRRINSIIEEHGYDFLRGNSIAAPLYAADGTIDKENEKLLHAVATLSANGDTKLADGVIKAAIIAGDYGNVIINESAGNTEYKVSRSPGYTLDTGYEDSCKSLFYSWINNNINQISYLDKPRVILYNGRINTPDVLKHILELIGQTYLAIQNADNDNILRIMIEQKLLPQKKLNELKPHEKEIFNNFVSNFSPYVVICSTGFSDNVLGLLQMNWMQNEFVKPYPLVIPSYAIQTSQQQTLLDLAAITGSTLFDPVNKRLQNALLSNLGPSLLGFQATRTTSTFIGTAVDVAATSDMQTFYKKMLTDRITEVSKQSDNSLSTMDKSFHRIRLAKLSGGLAVIIVQGSSNGDIKERRDRVEDAVFAVKKAQERGCLPGACWGLITLSNYLKKVLVNSDDIEIFNKIIKPSLEKPLIKLLDNSGLNNDEIQVILSNYWNNAEKYNEDSTKSVRPISFDLVKYDFVDSIENGILDSAPAVEEALRNSLSIALQAGTMGAIVVFPRDNELERREASAAIDNMRVDNEGDVDDLMGGSGSAC